MTAPIPHAIVDTRTGLVVDVVGSVKDWSPPEGHVIVPIPPGVSVAAGMRLTDLRAPTAINRVRAGSARWAAQLRASPFAFAVALAVVGRRRLAGPAMFAAWTLWAALAGAGGAYLFHLLGSTP